MGCEPYRVLVRSGSIEPLLPFALRAMGSRLRRAPRPAWADLIAFKSYFALCRDWGFFGISSEFIQVYTSLQKFI